MKNILNMTNILFFTYCILLIWIIIFKTALSLEEIKYLSWWSINFIPFYYSNETSSHFREIMENLLIFVPFWIYLKMMNKSNIKIILFAFILSLSFEICQFVFKIWASDITDLIVNTFWAIIWIIVYSALVLIFKNTEKINKFLKIIALIFTVLFSSLMLFLILVN